MVKAMDRFNLVFSPQNLSWYLWHVISTTNTATSLDKLALQLFREWKDGQVYSLSFCFLQWYDNFIRFQGQQRSYSLQFPGRMVLAQLLCFMNYVNLEHYWEKVLEKLLVLLLMFRCRVHIFAIDIIFFHLPTKQETNHSK